MNISVRVMASHTAEAGQKATDEHIANHGNACHACILHEGTPQQIATMIVGVISELDQLAWKRDKMYLRKLAQTLIEALRVESYLVRSEDGKLVNWINDADEATAISIARSDAEMLGVPVYVFALPNPWPICSILPNGEESGVGWRENAKVSRIRQGLA
ncbi:MAG: hypothetical protein KGL39_45830 [Patescibacteria group bacterium]|nr:hypothetical protein [Patescibacteria group bacterium]